MKCSLVVCASVYLFFLSCGKNGSERDTPTNSPKATEQPAMIEESDVCREVMLNIGTRTSITCPHPKQIMEVQKEDGEKYEHERRSGEARQPPYVICRCRR